MRRFSKSYGIVAVIGLLSTTACLQKELTHTIYVSPAGVTWTAIEKDVRSDDPDPGTQMLEEQDYFLGVRAAQHGVARALHALAATRVNTTVLRRDRPFTVVTDAEFGDLAQLANAMMKLAHVRGEASIERDGCEKTFRAWLDPDSPGSDDPNPLADLMNEAQSYRVVLTSGRFLRGEGFNIEKDGAIAVPGAPTTIEDSGIMRVSLTWTEGWCAPQPGGVSRGPSRPAAEVGAEVLGQPGQVL